FFPLLPLLTPLLFICSPFFSMETLVFQDLDFNQTLVEDHLYFEQHVNGFGIAVAVLYLVVCVLGLAGNLLVIVVILKLDKMSSSTTVYIFNLSLADGLFMIGLPFIASQNFQNHWMFGDTACKAVMVLDGINQFTSVFCLTVMSVDRCMALLEPLRLARWRTPRCAKTISVFLWLFSLLTILPMALHFSADGGLCIPDSISDSWWLGGFDGFRKWREKFVTGLWYVLCSPIAVNVNDVELMDRC
uniref:G-protein coupled receptors family 1 profile domain-containing protein n=1 Tax=Oryzias latipes TaxID=8090 RepID=A0A3P9HM08_ORYLA